MSEPDPFYDVVVLVHILGAVVGFGGLACTGILAALARRGTSSNAGSVRRYFNGRTNWVARTIYSVPILGLVLMDMSDGAFQLDEAWMVVSLALWVMAVVLAELVVWPGEQFIAVAAGGIASDEVEPSRPACMRQVCLRVTIAAAACVVIFGASLVIMLVKPGR